MVIALINAVTFMSIATWLGGDAINGGASGGHYYLKGHGPRFEVSHGTWIYSRIHAISTMISAPFFLGVGFIRNRLKKEERSSTT